MNPNVKEIIQVEDSDKVCNYCHSSEVNPLEWGPLYHLDGVTVHYFCMLFSAGLSQNGDDEQGILGFLPRDVRKELRRGEKLKCKFCRGNRATIGCSVKTCKASYHYPCGLKENCVFHFIGNFESYCGNHREKVRIPLPKSEWECPICFTEVTDEEHPLWPPCCKKRVFHKKCIMEMAKNHGEHFFKCPLCNDRETFSVAMRKSGVYLPDRDAAWEMEPNAYEEHSRLYSRCDADPCRCPKGRLHDSKDESRPWKIVRCGACGAAAVHRSCGKLRNLTWRCTLCADILSDKRKSEPGNNSSRIRRHHYDTSSDEEDNNTLTVPIIGIKEVIEERHESQILNQDSENADSHKVVFSELHGKMFVPEHSESEEEGENSDNKEDDDAEEVFVSSFSNHYRNRTNNRVSPVLEIRKPPKRKLRAILKDINEKRCTTTTVNSSKSLLLTKMLYNEDLFNRNRSHNAVHNTKRRDVFTCKLNEIIVKCRQRQNSSTAQAENMSDCVSNPVRAVSSGNTAITFPPLEKNTLVNANSKRTLRSLASKVVVAPVPEVTEESQAQNIKISLKSRACSPDSSGSSQRRCASTTLAITESHVAHRPLQLPSTSKDTQKTNITDETEGNKLKVNTEPKSNQVYETGDSVVELIVDEVKAMPSQEKKAVIDLIVSEDESSDDVEILQEKVKPQASSKSSAVLELLDKAKGLKRKPAVRLGVDDDEIDKIEFVESVNPLKPSNNFSSFSASTYPISAAFLNVIRKAKQSHFSGSLSEKKKMTAGKEKIGPDRDVEIVDLDSEDEDKNGEERAGRSNQGEALSQKSSKKRNRLSSGCPSMSKDSIDRHKKPRN